MYDAIVLAGGSGRRLGGVDKAALEVGGQSLLARVLAAVGDAHRVVVVGPARDLPVGVVGTSEQPPGGGPVAGLAAGLALVDAPLVAVLASDLPFVSASTLLTLAAALDHSPVAIDGAQVVDEAGRGQPLTAVYRSAPLRAAIATLDEVANAPLRAVVAQLTMLDVEGVSQQASDCDTWADVDRARAQAGELPLEEP